jgi:hypothetical protein
MIEMADREKERVEHGILKTVATTCVVVALHVNAR